MEDSLQKGQRVRVHLVTTVKPTYSDMQDFYVSMKEAGYHATMPSAVQVNNYSVTSFELIKGSPLFALLIPLIPVVITGALIAYSINQVSNIANSVLPVFLVVGGVGIAIAVIAGYSPHGYQVVRGVTGYAST